MWFEKIWDRIKLPQLDNVWNHAQSHAFCSSYLPKKYPQNLLKLRAWIQQVKITTLIQKIKLLHNKRRYELIYIELAIQLRKKKNLSKCLKEKKV